MSLDSRFFYAASDLEYSMGSNRLFHWPSRNRPLPSTIRAFMCLTLGLALSACSPSAPRTPSLPPTDWRLVPEATVLGEHRQFFLYGRKLDSAKVTAPPGVETETGEVLNDGRVLSLYFVVHPMVEDTAAGEKERKRSKAGSREIRVSTPDTSVNFTIKVVDEVLPR